MLLLELYRRENSAYQDVAQDNSQPQLGDLRKTKLTLRQINKMRRLNDVRQYEFREQVKKVKTQYSPPAQPLV
jgi:hypothetical protein